MISIIKVISNHPVAKYTIPVNYAMMSCINSRKDVRSIGCSLIKSNTSNVSIVDKCNSRVRSAVNVVTSLVNMLVLFVYCTRIMRIR